MTTRVLSHKLDIDEVAESLMKAGVSPECSICGHDPGFKGWMISDELVSVVPWRGSQFIFDGGYPCILVGCHVCGHTSLFSAKTLGLMND